MFSEIKEFTNDLIDAITEDIGIGPLCALVFIVLYPIVLVRYSFFLIKNLFKPKKHTQK